MGGTSEDPLLAEIRRVKSSLLEAMKHRDERQRQREREFENRLNMRLEEIKRTLQQINTSGREGRARRPSLGREGTGGGVAAAAAIAARLGRSVSVAP